MLNKRERRSATPAWLRTRAAETGMPLASLVQRYERRLVRVILRFVSDPELARDLAQETFLRAYVRFDQFDPSRRFGPWLFRIGVNLTFDYLRRRRRRGKWSVFTDYWNSAGGDPETPDPRGAARHAARS